MVPQTIKNRYLTVLLSALLVLTGCGTAQTGAAQPSGEPASPPASENGETVFPYTFTDSAGRAVTLQAAPERVAVLFSSYAEVWLLAGGEVSVTVGESVQRGFAPEGTALVDGGAGKEIDEERLLSYEPDLVIGSADIAAQASLCEMLSEAGIPAALFQVDTFDEYLSMLKICTDLTGCGEAYQTAGVQVGERIDAIQSETASRLSNGELAQQRILFIRAGSKYSSTKAKRAPDNFVCVMLDELGAYNIADNAETLLDGLSLEEILREDPDYIFLTTMGSEEAAKAYIADLFSQEGWRDLTAVAGSKYAFLPKELFHFKPNDRWADAYAYLAELLYPSHE